MLHTVCIYKNIIIIFYILGNKMNNIAVVYTLWGNLKKTSDMEVGQVGFYSNKEVGKDQAVWCQTGSQHFVRLPNCSPVSIYTPG